MNTKHNTIEEALIEANARTAAGEDVQVFHQFGSVEGHGRNLGTNVVFYFVAERWATQFVNEVSA